MRLPGIAQRCQKAKLGENTRATLHPAGKLQEPRRAAIKLTQKALTFKAGVESKGWLKKSGLLDTDCSLRRRRRSLKTFYSQGIQIKPDIALGGCHLADKF